MANKIFLGDWISRKQHAKALKKYPDENLHARLILEFQKVVDS